MPKAKAKTEPKGVKDVMQLLDASAIMDDVEEAFRLQGSRVDRDVRDSTRLSSGLLTLDLIYGGGYYPGGWYTNFGDEGSGKSTTTLHGLVSLLMEDVPMAAFMEPEGTSTEAYIQAIASHMMANLKGRPLEMESVFGRKDAKGKWVVKPRIRYYPENSLERIWKAAASMLRRLPDKVYDDGEWWLMFPRTKANISKLKGLTDAAMTRKNPGKLVVKSLDGGRPQAVILIDSFASMVAESEDSDDGDDSIALDARAHSRHSKKVKGKLRRKHAILLGVNQVSANINTRGGYGPSETETGGKRLRFNSDVRLRMAKRKHPKSDGYEEIEPSVDGSGSDQYRFIGVRTIKNKYGTPQIEEWLRLWEVDSKGECQGMDPVWDTWNYLRVTGQCKSTNSRGQETSSWAKAKHEVVMVPEDPEAVEGEMFSLPPMDWPAFKRLVLLRGRELKEHCAKLGIKTNPRLRERCFEQVKSGVGVRLFHELR